MTARRVLPSASAGLRARTRADHEAVESARVGVICYNAGGDIIGGGSDYPNLWPANGEIVVEASITTSGKPAKCVAHARHDAI